MAVAANDGVPLWVNINGVGYSYSTNETDVGLAAWGATVLGVVCQALELEQGESPATCEDYLYPPLDWSCSPGLAVALVCAIFASTPLVQVELDLR